MGPLLRPWGCRLFCMDCWREKRSAFVKRPKNKQLVAWVSKNKSSPALIVCHTVHRSPILFCLVIQVLILISIIWCISCVLWLLEIKSPWCVCVCACVCACMCMWKDAHSLNIRWHIFPALSVVSHLRYYTTACHTHTQIVFAGTDFKISSSTQLLKQKDCSAAEN